MKNNNYKNNLAVRPGNNNPRDNDKNSLPIYPVADDIYTMDIEVDIDPEDMSEMKQKNEVQGRWNEKDFREDKTGGDLDIPGAELDDEQEAIGSEDEENSYYSIGGDNHHELEEYNRG